MATTFKSAWYDNTVRVTDDAVTLLVQAYRWHKTVGSARLVKNAAIDALKRARLDVAEGKRRYASASSKPYPAVSRIEGGSMAYVESVENAGLRLVGYVMPDRSSRNGYWHDGDCGWHTNADGDVYKDGSGLCYGAVYQLPGHKGFARFVAGYLFGGQEGGPLIDLGKVYIEKADDYNDNARDMDSCARAALAADSMAEKAAEEEREYNTAWRAGTEWCERSDEVKELRKSIISVLADRRKAKRAKTENYAFVERLVREKVSDELERIAKLRREMQELASGDFEDLVFYPNNRVKGAFNDGADELVLR